MPSLSNPVIISANWLEISRVLPRHFSEEQFKVIADALADRNQLGTVHDIYDRGILNEHRAQSCRPEERDRLFIPDTELANMGRDMLCYKLGSAFASKPGVRPAALIGQIATSFIDSITALKLFDLMNIRASGQPHYNIGARFIEESDSARTLSTIRESGEGRRLVFDDLHTLARTANAPSIIIHAEQVKALSTIPGFTVEKLAQLSNITNGIHIITRGESVALKARERSLDFDTLILTAQEYSREQLLAFINPPRVNLVEGPAGLRP